MENEKWKVVDSFNGSVVDYCSSKEEGEKIAQRKAHETVNLMGMQNVICMYEVVPSTYTWGWDERLNKFV